MITKALVLSLLMIFTKWQTYADPAKRYSLEYPPTWEVNATEEGTMFLSQVESDSDTFRENVNVVIQELGDQPTTAAEYTQATKDWVAQSGGTLQLEREITLAGMPATEVAYTMPPNAIGSEYEMMFHQVWILKDAKAYLLTYTAQPQSYEKFEADGAGIFKSFTLGQ